MIKDLTTPLSEEAISQLKVGDVVTLTGYIYTGRDAVLPKIVKLEIECTFGPLSRHGVKMHLGKGAISKETVAALQENNAVFAIIPPVTALLGSQTVEQEIVAFPELGMEAFNRLKVVKYQAIIAAAKGESIYNK